MPLAPDSPLPCRKEGRSLLQRRRWLQPEGQLGQLWIRWTLYTWAVDSFDHVVGLTAVICPQITREAAAGMAAAETRMVEVAGAGGRITTVGH